MDLHEPPRFHLQNENRGITYNNTTIEIHEPLELAEVAPRLTKVYEHIVRLWRSSAG